jgi:hypothetical protein
MRIPGFSAEMALSTVGQGYRQRVKVLTSGSHISLIRAAAISTQQCELESTLTVEEAGGTTTYNTYACTTTVGGGGGPGSGPGGSGSQPGGKGGGGGGGGQKGSKPKPKPKPDCVDRYQNCYIDCSVKYPEFKDTEKNLNSRLRVGCFDSCDAGYSFCSTTV